METMLTDGYAGLDRWAPLVGTPRGRTVTVFGASSDRIPPAVLRQARELGGRLAGLGLAVVTGGGSHGVMGAVAAGALDAGGVAVGVIPAFMDARGWAEQRLTRTVVVPDMAVRKGVMLACASVAVACPGGVGTLDEAAEALAMAKLGLWDGRLVILDTDGYYAPLRRQLELSQAQGYGRCLDRAVFAADPLQAAAAIESWLCRGS